MGMLAFGLVVMLVAAMAYVCKYPSVDYHDDPAFDDEYPYA